jgi:transposase-like protein
LPPSLTRCLCTTNIIENSNGTVRRTSQRVTHYQDADMALRWTAAGFIEAQKSFRKIQGLNTTSANGSVMWTDSTNGWIVKCSQSGLRRLS